MKKIILTLAVIALIGEANAIKIRGDDKPAAEPKKETGPN